MTFDPSLEQVIDQAIDARLLDVHTSIPAIVVSYDAAKCTASVKIALKKMYDTGELVERPIIPDVPVWFPQGGGFAMTFPLKAGDNVQLMVSERSTERWKVESGVVDPKDARKFNLSDSFILPVSGRAAIGSADAAKAKIVQGGSVIEMSEDGTIHIQNSSGAIRMSAAGKFAIAGAAELLTVIDNLIVALTSATTLTALGPQPFMPGTISALNSVKADLESIKE